MILVIIMVEALIFLTITFLFVAAFLMFTTGIKKIYKNTDKEEP